jgi:hypothetical protein
MGPRPDPAPLHVVACAPLDAAPARAQVINRRFNTIEWLVESRSRTANRSHTCQNSAHVHQCPTARLPRRDARQPRSLNEPSAEPFGRRERVAGVV